MGYLVIGIVCVGQPDLGMFEIGREGLKHKLVLVGLGGLSGEGLNRWGLCETCMDLLMGAY